MNDDKLTPEQQDERRHKEYLAEVNIHGTKRKFEEEKISAEEYNQKLWEIKHDLEQFYYRQEYPCTICESLSFEKTTNKAKQLYKELYDFCVRENINLVDPSEEDMMILRIAYDYDHVCNSCKARIVEQKQGNDVMLMFNNILRDIEGK